MHSAICDDNESAREDGKPNNILPHGQVVKSKCAQDGRTGDLNIKAIFMIDQSQIGGFVDDECLEAIMEDR